MWLAKGVLWEVDTVGLALINMIRETHICSGYE